MMFLWVIIYGILLCFTRFSGVCGSSYMPLFTLFEDPTLYPNDIYVQGSTVATTSYLYPLLRIFGKVASNTYFIFFLYIIVSLAHVYFIFKIAETLFSNLKKYNIGLILLLLFLYDYPIFMAHSQLVYQHTFSQTVVAMPILAASLYYYFKDRLLLSIFLVSVLAIPLHFKSAWIIFLFVIVYSLVSYKKFNLKQITLVIIFIFTSGIIMYFYRTQCKSSSGAADFATRLALCESIMRRGGDEEVILMNRLSYFIKFFLVVFSGLWCIRFVKDLIHRRKLYFLYAITGFVFVFAMLYSSYLYKFIPIPEIAILGFPRSMAYPIIISILVIGGALLTFAAEERRSWVRKISIFGLFALAFFPNFKISVLIYIACIIIAYYLFYRNKKFALKMKLTPLTTWFYMAVILFLLARVVQVTLKSYKVKSPFFPLVVFGLERESYDWQVWTRANTPKDSVFAFFKEENHTLIHDPNFRRFSGRSMLYGDYANFYLNYGLYQEHLRREKFINDLIQFIVEGKQADIKSLIKNAPWKLDYIILPNRFTLEYPQVHSDNLFTCYLINSK